MDESPRDYIRRVVRQSVEKAERSIRAYAPNAGGHLTDDDVARLKEASRLVGAALNVLGSKTPAPPS